MPAHVPFDHTGTPARQTVDAAALRQLLEQPDPPRVLDVRTPAEFGSVHIPGAYNVPLDTLREHRDEIARHLDEAVVLVCRSGQRAGQAEQALAAAGLPNVRILQGGMQAWQRADGPVKLGRHRWDLERQVRLVAGSLVFGSVLASAVVPRLKWLAGCVGAGLGAAAVSNTCVMGSLLSKLPYNRDADHDPRAVIAQLAASAPGDAVRA